MRGNIDPAGMKKQESDFLVMEAGMEVGLRPIQALQVMYVVNNRPVLFGDALPGLAYAAKKMAKFDEWYEIGGVRATAAQEAGPVADNWCACCLVQRVDMEQPLIRRFSVSDAKSAGLWGKDTYKQYGKRMIRMRARAFAFRDGLADVLKGFGVFEEVVDVPRRVFSEVVPLSQSEPQSAEPDPLAKALNPQPEPAEEMPPPVEDNSDWRENVDNYIEETGGKLFHPEG